MLPIGDNSKSPTIPFVSYALIGLNVLIYLWDRQGSVFGQSVVFSDLAMRPHDVMDALRGRGESFPLVTLFTSLFLHGSLLHLIGNMLYLLTFGPAVEWGLGSWRFALYYLFWGIAACAAQIFVDIHSDIGVVGASGAIGGVLGCYLLLFPGNKLEIIIIPLVPVPVISAAWILLTAWFLFQIFFPQEGVANWAHVGGFLAGMLTILIMGGRDKVLAGRTPEVDLAFD